MRGRRHSAAGLRAALDEAQLRSLQHQRLLREAGERGQVLLGEELALRRRLQECRSELQAWSWRAGAEGAELGGEDAPLRTDASPAYASTASDSSSPPLGSALRQSLALRTEKRRLLQQNLLLAEELEEQEREWATQQCGDPPLEEERLLARVRSAEIADAVDGASCAERKRNQVHEALARELSEVQLQVCSMLGAPKRQLDAAHARNETLLSELHNERALRAESSSARHEAIERLRTELAEMRRSCEAAGEELLELQRRLTAPEFGQVLGMVEPGSIAVPSAPSAEAELLGSEWRSAAEVPRCGLEGVRPRDSSSSAASETWDGFSLSEVDFGSVSGVSVGRRTSGREDRRRLRARTTHGYHASDDVLMVKALAPGPGAPALWADALGGIVDGALSAVDGIVAKALPEK